MLFATPLLVDEPFEDRSDAISALAETIRARAASDGGVKHSNLGGWQSTHDFLSWSGEEGAHLIRRAIALCNDSTLSFATGRLQRDPLNWSVTAWANVNGPGDGNAAHVHPGAYWSGCFYADDGGIGGEEHIGGALEFTDPRGPLPLMYAPTVKFGLAGCVNAGLGEQFFPKTGQLVVFPSWLRHSVTPYHGTRKRISVAFNLSLAT